MKYEITKQIANTNYHTHSEREIWRPVPAGFFKVSLIEVFNLVRTNL